MACVRSGLGIVGWDTSLGFENTLVLPYPTFFCCHEESAETHSAPGLLGRWIELGDANSSCYLENLSDDNSLWFDPSSFLNPKQVPKEVADIFNAPSDDEEFVGFRDDVPMETLSSEESCDSFDSLESGKQVRMVPFMEGLVRGKPGSRFPYSFI